MSYTVVYRMERGGKQVAQVVTLASGKCIVSWPTSVIVYDSEKMARAVHVQHMGGRGEKTKFILVWSDGKSFERGWQNSMQDDMEGCPFSALSNNYTSDVPVAPDWQDIDAESYVRGYEAGADVAYGMEWRLIFDQVVKEQQAARAKAVPQ